MKTKNKFALSAAMGLAMAAMAAPVMAADVVYQEPPAPQPVMEAAPVSTWAGAYGGVQLGYGFAGKVKNNNTSINTDGWLGGAFGGFNLQDGQFVYGAEGDVNYSRLDGTDAGTGTVARSRVDGSIRARAGVAVTDDVLLYGTAGLALEKLRLTNNALNARDSNTMVGYTVGAGSDIKLTDNVFARGEYRFTDYRTKTFSAPGLGSTEVDSRNHRVTMGVGIKF